MLTALDDTTATLRVDGKLQTLSIAAVAARFDGAFTTFWTGPRAFREQVAAGEEGPDVDWIAARLAAVEQAAAAAVEPAARRAACKSCCANSSRSKT